MKDNIRLDALVCNAGALLNEKTISSEGVEVTFATHLLFGTYLLGSLALPTLSTTQDSRLVIVSSGGMYNSKFPAWEDATSTGIAKYDGQFAYVYAKRGQILLTEQWAKQYSGMVKVVSCHPGWTLTEGVEAAYGESKSYLEPLRSVWEGAEGIIWLCVAPKDEIEDGAFYLDRKPQVKHMSGFFYSEGSFTKNSAAEVADMMHRLSQWANGDRPSYEQLMIEAMKRLPLQASTIPTDLQAFMGDWHVLANIPTYFEVDACNCIEHYTYDNNRQVVRVRFEYMHTKDPRRPEQTSKASEVNMRGTVVNQPVNTHWKVDPKVVGVTLPLQMDNLILEVSNIDPATTDISSASEGAYCIVGVPDRSYVWIMTRARPSQYLPTSNKVAVAYPQLDISTSSSSSSGAASAMDISSAQNDAAVTREVSILRKALVRLEQLGYDTSKVVRCGWNNDLIPK